MTILHRLMSVVRGWLRPSASERALDDELQAFVEMAAAEKMRDGMPAAEARRLALVELGGVEQVKEQVRTGRHGARLEEIGRDIRYAGRMFWRNPVFTATVVVTLALGIGANTAIFNIVDALMLRQLPVRNPHELVQLSLRAPDSTDAGGDSLSYAIVRALAERRDIFAGVGGFSGSRFDVGSPESLTRVRGAFVTGGFYEALGLAPAAGRLLIPADDQAGAPLVAVISYGYWERTFAGAASAIGQTIQISSLPVTIVGVSPRGFVGANVGAVADITMPVSALAQTNPAMAALLEPGNFWLRVLARPQAGVSRSEATARTNAIWGHLADSLISKNWNAARRKEMAAQTFVLTSGGTGWTYLREMFTKPLYVLMAMVALVLLIACANVASLLLARASARQKEIAVRLAIGASRGRLVRQLLIESLLLSLAGAAAGVGLAWVFGEALVGMVAGGPADIVLDLAPTGHVLAFTVATAVATALLFGIAPAIQATAAKPSGALKDDVRTATTNQRTMPLLVSGQVALSVVLLAGAFLFVRTLQNLERLDPGFTADDVVLLELDDRQPVLGADLLNEVRALPGVTSASITTHTPVSGAFWSEPAVPAGQQIPDKDTALFVGAGPGFLETMRIPLVAGRDFTSSDSAGSPAVAIVNERYAQQYFPGRNPVGERLAAMVNRERREYQIVGLARSINAAGLREAPPATIYVAYEQLSGNQPATFVVRVNGATARVMQNVKDALQRGLPGKTLDVRLLAAQLSGSIVKERMMAALAAAFGLLALTLACIGLYGLIAYNVAQRTREIGIRMALGAPSARVVAHVLGRATRLVVFGLAIGLPAAWFASRWIESMLFGLTPTDPIAIGGSIVTLLVAAELASYLPARRASRVDPLTALRHD